MHPLALSGNYRIAAGIVLGILFGILLIKSGLAWRKTLMDIFNLKDASFLKTFLVSVSVGTALFYFAQRLELVNVNFRPVYFWGALSGGILAGVGASICGLFPSSAVASAASGRSYAVWVIIGMLLAMPATGMLSKFLSKTIYSWSAPFNFCERLDGYFSGGMAVIWISSISIILTLFLHFTIGSGGGEEG